MRTHITFKGLRDGILGCLFAVMAGLNIAIFLGGFNTFILWLDKYQPSSLLSVVAILGLLSGVCATTVMLFSGAIFSKDNATVPDKKGGE